MEGGEKEGWGGRREGAGHPQVPELWSVSALPRSPPGGSSQDPEVSTERFNCGAGSSSVSLRPYPGIFTFTLLERTFWRP